MPLPSRVHDAPPADRRQRRRMFSGAGTCLALACLILTSAAARAQISPGPLSQAHAQLDRPLSCLKCHGPGKETMRGNCLSCHEGIAWLMDNSRGLHAREATGDCASCHPEHAGRSFELIDWAGGVPGDFDHDRTGWKLEGRHAALECAGCHQPRFMSSTILELLQRRSHDESWAGLETGCISCHEDAHHDALGSSCLDCHTQRVWKPAPAFDHGRTSFPLTGQHVTTSCDACHRPAGSVAPTYAPLPHQECATCHRDPHAGRLGEDCSRCHVADSFQLVARDAFDHQRTRYPLLGKHLKLECGSCHGPAPAWGKKPPFAACGDCHADAHAGAATLADKREDCAACHTVNGFRPSTYTVEQHRQSAYALLGRHQAVACQSCHLRGLQRMNSTKMGAAGVLLRMPHASCTSCHEDAHAGQLSRRKGKGACESCHGVHDWAPSSFSMEDHAALPLPLKGRHAEVKCAACHAASRKGLPPLPALEILGKAGVVFAAIERRCEACHTDPHQGKLESVRQGCASCHGFSSFRPAQVDAAAHASFGFSLEGAHRAVPCLDCHAELNRPAAASSLIRGELKPAAMLFRKEHDACSDCHSDPHGGQFTRHVPAGGCARCHGLDSFRPASAFDHDRDTQFALSGAHEHVPCAGCHALRTDAQEQQFIDYADAPTECRACHAGVMPKS